MYDYSSIEKKWQKYWSDNNTFKTDVWDFSKPKFYALDMFPYPSGVGLHVGHPEGYVATDIVARMKRMQGFNVLHPMGYDSFGLPSEQYAINTGNHPGEFTNENIKIFRRQLQIIGLSYDWDREISTADPDFYKWTQYIFTLIYKEGLAFIKEMPVNWCEELGTVLANDEVIDGKSERGGFPVERKNLKQWVIDMPKYADRLLYGLDNIDWPNSTKEIERNWIGRSEGCTLKFDIKDADYKLKMFTTRADTIFGITFVVVSVDHEILSLFKDKIKNIDEIKEYEKLAKNKSDIELGDATREKTGIKIKGLTALNPFSGKEVPIFVGDYVLSSYGTGAIIAVPAHDQRDYDFAKKFKLEILPIIEGGDIKKAAFEDDGVYINSDFLNGIKNRKDGIKKAIDYIEKKDLGERTINYKMREWVFARQRYWGEPIPVVYDKNDNVIPLKLSDLPLTLPELSDYKPGKGGAAPLDKATDWVNTVYEGKHVKRETSTMPGSAGSSWYFLRYIDPHNNEEIANQSLLKHWMPVDLYVGGSEHATGHLLYSRMWNKFLFDKKLSPVEEPISKLVHPGMILGANSEKMSKSKGNVVSAEEFVNRDGADTLRLYEMFMGPIEVVKPWSTTGVEGIKRFIDRFYRLLTDKDKIFEKPNATLEKVYHQTIKKVTEDFNKMAFNTAIAQLMIFINAAYKEDYIPLEYARGFVKLISPITPHIGEELWQILGGERSIAYEAWPKFDSRKLIEDEISIVVQVNGKLKAIIKVKNNSTEKIIEESALSLNDIKSLLVDKTIIKTIVIKNKLINFVVQ